MNKGRNESQLKKEVEGHLKVMKELKSKFSGGSSGIVRCLHDRHSTSPVPIYLDRSGISHHS
jgi:hypothetical protein